VAPGRRLHGDWARNCQASFSRSTRRRIAARAADSFSGSVRSKTTPLALGRAEGRCVEGARSHPAECLSELRRAPDRSEQRRELPPELPPTRELRRSLALPTPCARPRQESFRRLASSRSRLALVRARIALQREPPGDRIEVDSHRQRARADRSGGLQAQPAPAIAATQDSKAVGLNTAPGPLRRLAPRPESGSLPSST